MIGTGFRKNTPEYLMAPALKEMERLHSMTSMVMLFDELERMRKPQDYNCRRDPRNGVERFAETMRAVHQEFERKWAPTMRLCAWKIDPVFVIMPTNEGTEAAMRKVFDMVYWKAGSETKELVTWGYFTTPESRAATPQTGAAASFFYSGASNCILEHGALAKELYEKLSQGSYPSPDGDGFYAFHPDRGWIYVGRDT